MGACSGGPALPALPQGASAGLGVPGPQVMCPLSPDPHFYQEVRERGLNTGPESDDDLLDESCSPEGTRKVAAPIVVKTYRPPQVTWSQLPEVGPGRWVEALPEPWAPVLPVGGLPRAPRLHSACSGGLLPSALREALP